ncbi:MAG: DUF5723 family protein [Bacteroidota bacterium]|nr:DUF5723 family protein [Bacteroidota bacterium]
MKKLITNLLVLSTFLSNAQHIVNYGMLGNPTNLISNPSADPMTNFHLGYAYFNQDLNFGLTAGDLFAGGNGVLGNLSALDKDLFTVTNELHLDAINIGFKIGKNYLYAGTQLDFWTRLDVDLDMIRFAYSGMTDDLGNLDSNFVGDFSDFGFSQDAIGTAYIGFQRSFWDNRLRIGAAYNQNRYYAGVRMITNELSLTSTPQTNGLVELDVGIDLDIISSNFFDKKDITDLSVDSLKSKVVHFDKDGNINVSLPNLLATPMGISNSFNIGFTAMPLRQLEFSFNINGLGISGFTGLGDAQHKLKESKNISGFVYNSQPGDTIVDEINNVIAEYIDELDSLNTTLYFQTPSAYEVVIPRTIQSAMNFYISRRSYIGIHYTSRSNSVRDYDYLGFNGFWWCANQLQVKAGYYVALDGMNANFLNLALQFRLTPLMQVFVGTRSLMDFATIGNELISSEVDLKDFTINDLVVPSNFSNIHLTAGASLSLFDKRLKDEKKTREAAKKGNEVKKISKDQEVPL